MSTTFIPIDKLVKKYKLFLGWIDFALKQN